MTSQLSRPGSPEADAARSPEAGLHNGDRLSQEEFHRLYAARPAAEKWELVKGTAYLASPTSRLHGQGHSHLGTLFGLYGSATPGVEVLDNATVILSEQTELQPDLQIRILPGCGGQSREEGGYIVGPPELVAEVSYSSRALDLHAKRSEYREAGVREYLILNLADRELVLLELAADREKAPDADGVLRSVLFPGLWLDAPALLGGGLSRAITVLQQGLASGEHAAFVAGLESRRGQP